MDERERLIATLEAIPGFLRDLRVEAVADCILAAGFHDGPRIPAHGSAEEAAAVERMLGAQMNAAIWASPQGAVLAALRAIHPEAPAHRDGL